MSHCQSETNVKNVSPPLSFQIYLCEIWQNPFYCLFILYIQFFNELSIYKFKLLTLIRKKIATFCVRHCVVLLFTWNTSIEGGRVDPADMGVVVDPGHMCDGAIRAFHGALARHTPYRPRVLDNTPFRRYVTTPLT